MNASPTTDTAETDIDGPYAWWRLAVSLAVSTVGGIGLWSVVVVLPTIEAEFGVSRGDASLPYATTMLGFACGGILMGRMVDRFGIFPPLVGATILLTLGYAASAQSTSLTMFAVIQTVMIGLGSAVSFAPMVADITHWFDQRRGIAVAVVASGNYLSGTVWPPILTWLIAEYGWRDAHVTIGIVCLLTMLPLAFLLRRRPSALDKAKAGKVQVDPPPFGVSRNLIQVMLIVAGLSCCVAMSMPQVHIVAYCGDLGYGAARGAEMLSIMLGLGIVSRIASGMIADKIGGLGTLVLGSALQCVALIFYLPFDGLASLYVVSAIFGLSQGGIVPSYALIVRRYFPANEAGTRVSVVLMTTVAGMALGGWLSGEIYDLTGSYQAAFLNGIAWNLLNLVIAAWLLIGNRRMATAA